MKSTLLALSVSLALPLGSHAAVPDEWPAIVEQARG